MCVYRSNKLPYLLQPAHVVVVVVRQEHHIQPLVGSGHGQGFSEQGGVPGAALPRLDRMG